jgi:soluble lytic murein transglycosylase-like protein
MNRLVVAGIALLCASSVSGIRLSFSDSTAGPSAAVVGELAPSVSAAPLPAADASETALPPQVVDVPANPEIEPAVARVLAQLAGRHTTLSRRDLIALAETIVEQASRHDLDPKLVLAVIEVESGGYNLAVSHVGARGLMQLMPATGHELARKHGLAWHGEESLFDPIINVKLGTAYLKQLSDKYDGNVQVALAAYNWGPGRIDRFLRAGSPVPEEYISRVMRSYTSLKGISVCARQSAALTRAP